MVCDTFKVNILLVSPDTKWIAAGTKDNNDLSPKVFHVVFDSLGFQFVFAALLCSSVLPHYLHLNDTLREKRSS